MSILSGQLFFRDTGIKKDGKKLFMVCGVVGIAGVNKEILSEHQYTIKDIKLGDEIDRSKDTIGETPDSIVQLPIWRV